MNSVVSSGGSSSKNTQVCGLDAICTLNTLTYIVSASYITFPLYLHHLVMGASTQGLHGPILIDITIEIRSSQERVLTTNIYVNHYPTTILGIGVFRIEF